MKLLSAFFITISGILIIRELQAFPQQKVDNLCFKPAGQHIIRDKSITGGASNKVLNPGYPFSSIDFSEHSERPVFGKKAALYIGPGTDTLFIDTNYVQDGDVVIFGQGVLLVDNAQFTLYGKMYGLNEGQAVFRNGAYLYVPQQYLSQWPQAFYDSSRFEATDATVYANSVYRTFLYDNSEYVTRRTTFPFWNFRQLYDHSKLVIEDANMVGDLTINDSCEVSFLRCDTILPWFGAGDGSIIDYQFPDYNAVDHFEFDSALTGVKGIKYKASFDSCNTVVWGIEAWPGCSVLVRNSVFCGTFRITGHDTLYFNKICDHTFYTNLGVPFNDRSFRAINSYTQIWCIYTYDTAVLYMDSCRWGESHSRENSEIFATACTTDGFPSCVTATDNGFYTFMDGKCRAIVSAWNRATAFLINAYVTPERPGVAQHSNIAHGHSYILAVNSRFDYNPEAADTSLVMFAAIDSFKDSVADTTVDINGSAWMDAGPLSTINFERYKLYWAYKNDSVWTLIKDLTEQVYDSSLAKWNTSGFSDGDYILRLTIWDDIGDSLTALRDITLKKQAVSEQKIIQTLRLNSYQNGAELRISFSAPIGKEVVLDMFDVSGRKVKNLFTGKTEHPVDIVCKPVSGVYFLRLQSRQFPPIIKKTVFIK